MVEAGAELLSARGYGVTMLDVVDRAEAPRGSIYYHFPNGKAQLALEVVRKVEQELTDFIGHVAARTADPVAFLRRMLEHHRKRLANSGFELGCPLMGMIASGDVGSGELADAIAGAFAGWLAAVRDGLIGNGIPAARACEISSAFVAGVEGCIVVARGTRSERPFEDFARSLPSLIGEVTP
jgi:TetR/AcrR family transcriptional repressor of lmrAB and yxaGH operons